MFLEIILRAALYVGAEWVQRGAVVVVVAPRLPGSKWAGLEAGQGVAESATPQRSGDTKCGQCATSDFQLPAAARCRDKYPVAERAPLDNGASRRDRRAGATLAPVCRTGDKFCCDVASSTCAHLNRRHRSATDSEQTSDSLAIAKATS